MVMAGMQPLQNLALHEQSFEIQVAVGKFWLLDKLESLLENLLRE